MDPKSEFDRLESQLYVEHNLERRVTWLQMHFPQPLRIRVVDCGPTTGFPVVFVHGGGGFGATFAPLLTRLDGIRAIVPDRPGFGLSEGVGLARIDLRRHAIAFLEGVFRGMEIESAPVVGTSMGGLWASWLALDRPAFVERLALLACPALALGTSAPLPLRLMGKAALGRRMLAMGPEGREGAYRMLAMLNESRAAVDRSGTSFADLMAAAVAMPGWRDSWIGLLGSSLTLTGAEARWALGEADVRSIRKPVLIAWGTRDPFGSVAVGRRFRELSGGRLVELEGAGHLPWLDEPTTIAAALQEFIKPAAQAPALEAALV